MDSRLLEYFVTVAAEESVTEAAFQLGVAQSTVSAGLRSLERDLNVTLFERTTRAVRLSQAGELLLGEAQETLERLGRLRALARGSAEGVRGRLRLGEFAAMESVYDIPGVVREFRTEFPGVDVSITTSPSGSTGFIDDLVRGRIDVALFGMRAPEELETVELATAPFLALVPPGHALATGRSARLADLASHDWIDVMPGHGNRLQLEHALAEKGLTRHLVAEVGTLPSVPSYVAAGLGVAVVPDIIDTSGCRVLQLEDRLPLWHLSLATRSGVSRRPHVAAFIEIFRRRFPGRTSSQDPPRR